MSAREPSRPDEVRVRRSQTDNVVTSIMRMVTAGELRAGQRLPIENDLAARLGVSRSSLREGVRALAVMGVLETRQGDGTYVTSLDASTLLGPLAFFADLQTDADAAHLSHVRRVLEAESASLAAISLTDEQLDELTAILDRVDDLIGQESADEDEDRVAQVIAADTQFHSLIARGTGNTPLAALIESIASRTQRVRMWRGMVQRGTVAEAQTEHRAILAELRRRDPGGARVRMEGHLMGVEDFARAHAEDIASS